MKVLNYTKINERVNIPKIIGIYIEKHFSYMPVYKNKNNYVFVKSEKFSEVIKHLPKFYQLLLKRGEYNIG